MELVKMFVNGQAMSGGSISEGLRNARFLGAASTAPAYRFYSVRAEFPGLSRAEQGGSSVAGELYEVSYAALRTELLPLEPPELELSIIELADGTGSLSMVMRSESIGAAGTVDITEYGGWRAYLAERENA